MRNPTIPAFASPCDSEIHAETPNDKPSGSGQLAEPMRRVPSVRLAKLCYRYRVYRVYRV